MTLVRLVYGDPLVVFPSFSFQDHLMLRGTSLTCWCLARAIAIGWTQGTPLKAIPCHHWPFLVGAWFFLDRVFKAGINFPSWQRWGELKIGWRPRWCWGDLLRSCRRKLHGWHFVNYSWGHQQVGGVLQAGGVNAKQAMHSSFAPQGVRNGLGIVPQIWSMIFAVLIF